MRKTDYLRLSIFFLLSFVLIAGQSSADTRRERQKQAVEERRERENKSGPMVFGLKAGFFGTGEIEYRNWEFDTESGMAYGLFMDYRLGQKTMLSFMFDMNEISYPRVDSKWLLNFGIGLKGNFKISQRETYLRPALAFGAAFLDEFGLADKSHYWTLRTYCEMVQQMSRRCGVLMEFGVIYSLYGSDGEYDISAHPRIFFRIGLAF